MYKTFKEHIITSADSLPHIANKYYGDPTRWLEIVNYNKLDYPYIVQNDTELDSITKASGYLTLKRSQFTSSLTLPKNTIFHTKSKPESPREKVYLSKEEIIIPAGQESCKLFVTSAEKGTFGNTSSYSVTSVKNDDLKIYFSDIYNEKPFNNGKTLNLKKVGQKILIPLTEGQENEYSSLSYQEYLTKLGQSDLSIGLDGELEIDSSGDLNSLQGLDNIKDAIKRRLITSKGELSRHQEYGTNVDNLVGKSYSYVNKLIGLYIVESLQYEDRIDESEILSYEQVGENLFIDVSLKFLNDSSVETVQIVL